MFDERRVAQIAAYFLQQREGTLSILKLIKLIYLADREAMRVYGEPLTFDYLVSMDHGPVPSQTLNHVNGLAASQVPDGWQEWISDRENHKVELRKEGLARDDFDELSDADIDVLNRVWAEFGHMNQWAIRDFTHTLPEWTDPHGSSIPIDFVEIFSALGLARDEAEAAAAHVVDAKGLHQALSA